MFYANNTQGLRTFIDEAEKSNSYFCPACGKQMVIRRGKIICHHFAHKANCICDPWYNGNGKSLWHRKMQAMFCTDQQEVIVWDKNRTVFHVADAVKQCRDGSVVYEFQHSPISGDDFIERSRYYLKLGYKLVWIFDYCTQSPPKTILYTKEQYEYEGKEVYHFVWPGRDRIKLFDSYEVRSFLSEECKSGGKLSVYFFVSTGLGRQIQCEYDFRDYVKWEYEDPFHRNSFYIAPYFSLTDDLSEFYARAYEKESFEHHYIYFFGI